MEQARQFVTLACPSCDGSVFVACLSLKHRPGGGLVADPCGWACLACQAQLDPQKALDAYSLKVKREELKALEEELGVTHATERG